MKHVIIFTVLFLFSFSMFAQKETFARLYDLEGKKFASGILVHLSDSSLTVKRKGLNKEIPVSSIGHITLRRSVGHAIFLGSLITGATFAIIGGVTADPDAWIFGYSAGEGIVTGFVGGAVTGALIGAIVGGTRKRPIFHVDGNPEKWNQVKELLKRYVVNE